jgi:hypothetical protein
MADFAERLPFGHRDGQSIQLRLRFEDRVSDAAAGQQSREQDRL